MAGGRSLYGSAVLAAQSIGVYGLSRAVTLLAAALAMLARPGVRLVDVLAGTWDAGLYLELVRTGYPKGGGSTADLTTLQATAAFFPLYPGAISLLTRPFGLSPALAGVMVSLLSGAVGTVLVALIARDLFGLATAKRAAVLYAFAPGAFVFSLTYSEGVMITCAAACLLCLLRRWWLLAGLAAGLATAARPNAVVLVACCAWSAAVAIRNRHEWRAIIAPVLAPTGVVGYFAFLRQRTGSWTYWFDVERAFWHDHIDLSLVHLRGLAFEFVHQPFRTPNVFVFGMSMVLTVVLLSFLVRARPPAELTIFALGIVAMAAMSATVYPNPRFLLTAFPLTLAIAATARASVYHVAMAVSASAMPLLLVFHVIGWVDSPHAPVLHFVAP